MIRDNHDNFFQDFSRYNTWDDIFRDNHDNSFFFQDFSRYIGCWNCSFTKRFYL